METIHRVSVGSYLGSKLRRDLETAGIKVPEDPKKYLVFELPESDPRWMAVSSVIKEHDLFDWPSTKFSSEELQSADYLVIEPVNVQGYPQPEDATFGRGLSCDLTDKCPLCGTGVRQTAPFRMTKEPQWGKNSILQMHWLPDEFFVTPLTFELVFKPYGIKALPVVQHKSGKELKTVLQLEASTTVELDMTGRKYQTCPLCGRRKYAWITIGYQPKPEFTEAHFFKSVQYFGDGAAAFKSVMVSQELYQKITEAKLKGVRFEPCQA